MRKSYFSGGTVAASIADIDYIKRRDSIEEFLEDGTASFLSIASIHHGFKIINTLTMSAISRHTTSLSTYVKNRLLGLRHGNGLSLCELYGLNHSEVIHNKMGPTISFNLKRADGSWFGYREVEKLASLSGIQLRTGCFCNPGACAKYLGLSHSDLLSNVEAGHVCWDDHDVLDGKPTGAVRVSFGYMSTFEDARRLLNFLRSNFLSLPSWSSHSMANSLPPPEQVVGATPSQFLKSITVYPIKSCRGFNIDSWPLTSTGLLHDREWVLKSTSGEILTQKKVPDMCYITTLIDLNLGMLFVESPRCKEKLKISLDSDLYVDGREEMDVHTRRYEVRNYNSKVDAWFSEAVGRACTLLRSFGSQGYASSYRNRSPGMCRDWDTRLNFVNEAQLLLISEESINDLNNRLRSNRQKGTNGQPIQVNPMRFRPNLVISGGTPYAEDGWKALKIGTNHFKSVGGCNRCQMININAEAEEVQRLNEPLATLAKYRRVKGKILFGVLLQYEEFSSNSDAWLHVGEEIVVEASK